MSENPKSLPEFPCVLHIGLFETIFFGSLILFFTGVGIWFYIHDAQLTDLLLTAFGVYCGLCIVKIHIRLTDEAIFYSCTFNLFTKPAQILWKDIQRTETGVESKGAKSFRYFTRLYEKEDRKPLEINIKWFGKNNLRLFGIALQEKARQAKLDEKTKDLAEGYVPSFVVGKGKPWV